MENRNSVFEKKIPVFNVHFCFAMQRGLKLNQF